MKVIVTALSRFFDHVDVTSSCWIWTGWTSGKSGYGRFWRDGKGHQAHRWLYEFTVGKISDGLCLDHLCRNTLCVNPDHLEPVTNKENCSRGNINQNKHVTCCKRGHDFDNINTYHRNGRRHCRTCRSLRYKGEL